MKTSDVDGSNVSEKFKTLEDLPSTWNGQGYKTQAEMEAHNRGAHLALVDHLVLCPMCYQLRVIAKTWDHIEDIEKELGRDSEDKASKQ